jgi:hypothetical protein
LGSLDGAASVRVGGRPRARERGRVGPTKKKRAMGHSAAATAPAIAAVTPRTKTQAVKLVIATSFGHAMVGLVVRIGVCTPRNICTSMKK